VIGKEGREKSNSKEAVGVRMEQEKSSSNDPQQKLLENEKGTRRVTQQRDREAYTRASKGLEGGATSA